MTKLDLKKIEDCFTILMEKGMGLDLSNPNLSGTPARIARMYNELFQGLHELPKVMATFPNDKKYDEIVMIDNIHFVSVCSHHFLPFTGKAWIAYIPEQILLGASKASRIIDHYSKRPQLQEGLCEDITNYLQELLNPKGVAVVLRGIHGCMACRGVKQYDNSGMITSSLRGVFKKETRVKNEVFDLINLSTKRL